MKLARAVQTAVLLFALTGVLPAGPVAAQSGPASFEWDELSIETVDGARHRFRIEIATSPAQQQQGLMFRRELAADAGMLFIYRPRRVISMWMRNTIIPLDMLFIAEDGVIVKIVERTVPLSLASISSDQRVRAVLEVNGGTVARLNLAPGDRVSYRAFDPKP